MPTTVPKEQPTWVPTAVSTVAHSDSMFSVRVFIPECDIVDELSDPTGPLQTEVPTQRPTFFTSGLSIRITCPG